MDVWLVKLKAWRSRNEGGNVDRSCRRLLAGARALYSRTRLFCDAARRTRLANRLTCVWRWCPLSARGWAGVVIAVWMFRTYGVLRQDRVLLAISGIGLAVIGVLALIVLGTAIWLRLRSEGTLSTSYNSQAESRFRTGYSVPLHWLPLITVQLQWPEFKESRVRVVEEADGWTEEIEASRRGLLERIVRRVTVSDVFGLCRVTFERTQDARATIYPPTVDTRRISPWSQHRAGDAFPHPGGPREGDLIELRDYAAGDPLKRVRWKTYSRTGRLIVRIPERAIEPCDRVTAAFVAGRGDNCSAAIAKSLLENLPPHEPLTFCADGEPGPTDDAREAIAQLVRCAPGDAPPASALDRLLDGGQATSCLLFVPNRPGTWLDAVVERLTQWPGRCRVIIGTKATSHRKPAVWQRMLLKSSYDDAQAADDLAAVYSRLVSAGADVTVIDRASGTEVTLHEIANRNSQEERK